MAVEVPSFTSMKPLLSLRLLFSLLQASPCENKGANQPHVEEEKGGWLRNVKDPEHREMIGVSCNSMLGSS